MTDDKTTRARRQPDVVQPTPEQLTPATLSRRQQRRVVALRQARELCEFKAGLVASFTVPAATLIEMAEYILHGLEDE